MRPLRARVLRWAARVALAALGALVLLVGALHTGPGRAWVKRRVERAADASMTGTLTIGELDYALFGKLALKKVVLKDAGGAEIASLDELSGAPAWSTLTGSAPTLSRLVVRGARLHVVVAADGSTNLDKLKKPKSKPTTKPRPKPPPSTGRLVVSELVVDDARVIVDREGGAHAELAVTHVEASIAAGPGRALELAAPKIELEAAVDAPGGGGVALRKLATAARVAIGLTGGDVTIGPTSAAVELTAEGSPPRGFPLSIAPLTLHVGEGGAVTAELGALDVGALALHAVEIHGHASAKGLDGEQRASIAGLKVDAEKLDGLAGKRLLSKDVEIEIGAAGPADKLTLTATLAAGPDVVRVTGEVDAHAEGGAKSKGQGPAFAVHVDAKDLDTQRFVGADVTAPRVTLERVEVDVKGHAGRVGACAEADVAKCAPELDARLDVDAAGLVVGDRARLETLTASAHLEEGVASLDALDVSALGQRVRGSGAFTLATKAFHVEVTPSGDGADAIEPLRALGVEAPPSLRALRIGDDALHVSLDGVVDAPAHVVIAGKKIGVAGGSLDVDADADVAPSAPGGDAPPHVTRAHAALALASVDVTSLAQSPAPLGASVSGRIEIDAAPDAAAADDPASSLQPVVHATAALTARVHARGGAAAARVELHAETVDDAACAGALVDAPCGRAKVTLHASPEGHKGAPVIAVVADVPLGSTPAVAASSAAAMSALDRRLDVRVDVAKVALEELARIARPDVDARGEVELHAHVAGTAHRPTGTFEGELSGALLSSARGVDPQRARLHGELSPSRRGGVDVEADLEGWPRAASGGGAPVTGHVALDLASFAARAPLTWSLALDTEAIDAAALPIAAERRSGVTGHVEAHAHLSGTRDDARGDVKLALSDLERAGRGPVGATVDLSLADDHTDVAIEARVAGAPRLTAKGTVSIAGKGLLAGRGGDPDLELALVVPDQAIASLSALAPALAGASARAHGDGKIVGKASAPSADLAITIDGYRTVDGGAGEAKIAIAASKKGASLGVGVGEGGASPLRVEAKIDFSRGVGALGIPELVATARAEDADLRAILPASTLAGRATDLSGQLACDVTATFAIKPSLRGLDLGADVKGDLSVKKARVTLAQPSGPGRVFDGDLALEAEGGEVRVVRLAAREAGEGGAARTLDVKGSLGVDDLAIERADLRVALHDWRVVAAPRAGEADPPHAIVSADVHVRGAFDQPKKTLAAEVSSLRIEASRGDRARPRRALGMGDVTSSSSSAPAMPVPGDRGWDIHAALANAAEVVRGPMRFDLRGALDVAVRPGARVVRGRFDLANRPLLGQRAEGLLKGAVVFDDAHPNGAVDLHLGPLALSGPLGASVGASSSDPAAEGLGQQDELVALAYLAVYLPHLLWLDRAAGEDEAPTAATP